MQPKATLNTILIEKGAEVSPFLLKKHLFSWGWTHKTNSSHYYLVEVKDCWKNVNQQRHVDSVRLPPTCLGYEWFKASRDLCPFTLCFYVVFIDAHRDHGVSKATGSPMSLIFSDLSDHKVKKRSYNTQILLRVPTAVKRNARYCVAFTFCETYVNIVGSG